MIYRLLANLTVLLHLGFILFVVAGGFLTWRWRRMIWIHLPCAVWAALIEFAGWICPLTPLENHFRLLAGQAGYAGGFVEHYLIPAMYPTDWSLTLRLVLGGFVVAVNAGVYWRYAKRPARGRP